MKVFFLSGKLQKQCSESRLMTKAFGAQVAGKIQQRLDDLYDAGCLEDMRHLPGRCHELKGERRGQLALCLNENYRLVFVPAERPLPLKFDGGLDWKLVDAVSVVSVEDYHGQ